MLKMQVIRIIEIKIFFENLLYDHKKKLPNTAKYPIKENVIIKARIIINDFFLENLLLSLPNTFANARKYPGKVA